MKTKRDVFLFLIVLCGFIVIAFPGCGKKGPPLPPEIPRQKIAAPFDLKYTLDDKEVTLFWQHKIEHRTAVVKPDGFEVFMAKKTFEACVGCPFVFKMIGVASMPDMQFLISLEKGYKYYFRVQATDDDNMRSEYSKTIQLEYK